VYKNLAPIVLFTYNRPDETLNTINSLSMNPLAKHSEIIVFSDGPKRSSELNNVLAVREVIHKIVGFKKVTIIESEFNKGLAESVIAGVSNVLKKYGKVIVVEDDLVCSEDFLGFMNQGLNCYQSNTKIWSICGYSNLKNIPRSYEEDYYLSVRSSSWGWATWIDRWNTIDWDVADYSKLKSDKKMRLDFELGGNDLFKMLELQMLGKIDSWAIRWVYSQFKQKAMTVYPVKSKIMNRGMKVGGTHANGSDSRWDTELDTTDINFPLVPVYNDEIVDELKKIYDLDWIGRIGYFLKRNGFYSYFVKFKKYLRN